MSPITNLARVKTARPAAGRAAPSRHAKRRLRRGKLVAVPNCKQEVALIADYLTAQLSPPLEHAFEQHLGGCSDCAAFLRTYKKTLELTRSFLKQQNAKPSLSFAALRAAAARR